MSERLEVMIEELDRVRAERDALAARVKALEADAGRYYALRHALISCEDDFFEYVKASAPEDVRNGTRPLTVEEFDALIDAVMRQEKQT